MRRIRDFEDADVLRVLREILPERDPLAHVERKVWELAMLALFLERADRRVLSARPAQVGPPGPHLGMPAIAKSPRRGLIVLGLLLASFVFLALMRGPVDEMSDRGVGIIEFELARTSEKASDYYGELGEAGRDEARTSLYLDYPYLILYGLFYAAACLVVAARAAERGMDRLARWGRPLAVAGLVAAACDAVENAALLRVLDGHTDQPWPAIAFTFATAKFALIAAAVLYVIVGFVLTLRSQPA